MQPIRIDNFFERPFSFTETLIKCNNGHIAFVWAKDFSSGFKSLIVKKLNRTNEFSFCGKWSYDGCNTISLGDMKVLEARGLGDLLNAADDKLTPYAATKVIDEFAKSCVDVLNN